MELLQNQGMLKLGGSNPGKTLESDRKNKTPSRESNFRQASMAKNQEINQILGRSFAKKEQKSFFFGDEPV